MMFNQNRIIILKLICSINWFVVYGLVSREVNPTQPNLNQPVSYKFVLCQLIRLTGYLFTIGFG